MTAARKLPPMMTVDDFLCWEGDGTDTRYELVDGVLRAMSPATNTHGRLIMNLGGRIHTHLDASTTRCSVVSAPGIRPLVRADWNFRIPDLGVTCEADRRGERYLSEPVLLIEVLSPSNEPDTYENIRAYATLPTVKELVVVHSTRMQVEHLRRGEDGTWPANPTMIGAGGSIHFSCIDLTVPIESVYRRTHLDV
ncbi:MAG: Uma2 family endonuclease [Hyphomicrobium aestuarii]|nr:Uma2 family endonuclease [Hyphomicrobium aestuarii]